MTKAKQKNILDDVAEGVSQILEDLERLVNPEKRRRPIPVPIPVRSRPEFPPHHSDDPYRR